MRRSLSMVWVGLAGLFLLTSGCGDPFAPPSRVKRSTADESSRSKPKYLVFVVPGPPVGDLEIWAMRAQHEANDKRAIFRIWGPSPSETQDQQPEAVRKALADGASALIVYPGDSPELPKVLAEAESKGVPVVLLGKSIPAPEGSKPFTVVDYAPFDESARKIVAATIEDLKKASQPVNGTAVVLADKVVDRTSSLRVAALKAAAEAAGFRQVVTVPFDGSTPENGKRAVLEAIQAHPDISVVLTDDGEGMVGAALARAESKGKPIFFVGGYTDYRLSQVVVPPARESCHVEGRYSELGGLAVLTALARLRGEKAGEHAYLTPKFTKTEGAVASETDHKAFPEIIKNTNLGGPETKEASKAEPPKDTPAKP